MRVAILGDGRMARAVQTLIQLGGSGEAIILPAEKPDLRSFDLALGALPGAFGPQALDICLEQRLDLVDLADIENNLYEEKRGAIEAAGLCVLPAAGFCPGLVDMILGLELHRSQPENIEVMAGSLSPAPWHFPFLWCFEDMVAALEGPSRQVIDGEERLFPAWDGYREEVFCGIEAESYLSQSGFEDMARLAGVRRFSYRNLRPRGFQSFFRFLRSHGAFEPEQLQTTKLLLEARVGDNLTLARIRLFYKNSSRLWTILCRAEDRAALNSMQRLTAGFALETLRLVAKGALGRGLHSSAQLGRDEALAQAVFEQLRRLGIEITCAET